MKLLKDCSGTVITTELLLISSVLVAGLLTCLNTFRSGVEAEFQELGNTIRQSTQTPLTRVNSAEENEPLTFEGSDLTSLLTKEN